MSFNSPSDNHETKHDPSHPAGTPQSPETGGNLQRVPADCAEGSTLRTVAGDCAAFANDPDFLRFISYVRACRSPAAVLCANTDAEDAVALAVYAIRSREAEECPPCSYCRRSNCTGECLYD